MNTQEIERRTYKVDELRAEGGPESPRITGYAARFNSLSEDIGGFYEQIAPGAFANTLLKADVRALFNHSPDYVLGRNRSGSLQLFEDEEGLGFDVQPPDTQWARDLLVSVRRGDINQMSFGFRTVRDKWEQVGGQVLRTLLEVELFDVSVVTYPAYISTSAAVRSQLESFTAESQAASDGANGEAAPDETAQAQVRNANRKRKLDLLKLR